MIVVKSTKNLLVRSRTFHSHRSSALRRGKDSDSDEVAPSVDRSESSMNALLLLPITASNYTK